MTRTNGDTTSTSSPRRLLLISVPRTASNLFTKILNIHNQPNVLTNDTAGYFFYPAFMRSSRDPQLKKPLDQWTDSQKSDVRAAFQQGLDNLEECSARAQKENKIMFAKEHAFWILNPAAFDKLKRGTETSSPEHFESFRLRMPDRYVSSQTFSSSNETVLSDEYLRSWQLAFIIRHPALAWPSFYRAMLKISQAGFIDDDGVIGVSRTNMTLRWTRMLYDWCLEQPGLPTVPLVIDAQEVIHDPQAVIQFCQRAGLDPSAVQFEWDGDAEKKRSESWAGMREADEQKEMHRAAASIMLSTLEGSTGIVKDKTPAMVDIAAEAQKWRADFGEEVAEMIEKAVWDSMPDYEYLRARCITASFREE